MKAWLMLLIVFSFNSFANTIRQASMEEVQVLAKYIAADWSPEATFDEALDDDELSTDVFLYKGELLKMITVYSGDNPYGPIYKPSTLEIVGNNSDGSLTIRGEVVEYYELEYDLAAELVTVKVEDFFCGEMDPFVVGDVCIVMVSQEERKTAIVLDSYLSHEALSNLNSMPGKFLKMNKKLLRKVYDRETLEVLRDFDSSYFYMTTDSSFEEIFSL